MRRFLAAVSFVAVCTSLLSAQSSAPAFDAADVHVRALSSNPSPVMSGGVLRAGRFDLRNATMVDLIAFAYGITDSEKILGGPNWLERDRFDIVAKAPQTTSPDVVNVMLQNLLADRFKLALHKDTKPQPALALTTINGRHKLKQASGNGE